MLRWAKLAVGVFAAAGGLYVASHVVRNAEVRRLTAQVDQLEQDKRRLQEFIRRLSASRRIAQVDVIDQSADSLGNPIHMLLWQEIAADGSLGLPQHVQAVGDLVYFEAAVIKFAEEDVAAGTPDRESSLAMFRRIFGDQQVPAGVPSIASSSLSAVSGEAAGVASLDARLWELFWQMMDDPELAAQYGVRVANVEAPAVLLRPGQVWEIVLDADAGLSLRIIGRRESAPAKSSRPDSS